MAYRQAATAKIARQTFRPDRDTVGTVNVPAERPEPPPHLSGEAAATWDDILIECEKQGIRITQADAWALEALVTAYVRMRQAAATMTAEGMTIKGQRSEAVKHPANSVFNSAFQQLRQMLTEFGLTPASRLKLPVAFDVPDDPFEQLVRDYAAE